MLVAETYPFLIILNTHNSYAFGGTIKTPGHNWTTSALLALANPFLVFPHQFSTG